MALRVGNILIARNLFHDVCQDWRILPDKLSNGSEDPEDMATLTSNADALYLLAVANRLRHAAGDFDAALACLDASDQRLEPNDLFGRWRNKSERAAVLLFQVLHDVLCDKGYLDRGEQELSRGQGRREQDVTEAGALLIDCLRTQMHSSEALERVLKGVPDATRYMGHVQLQLYTNLLSYDVLCRFAVQNPKTLSTEHVAMAFEQLEQLDGGVHVNHHSVTRIEYLAARIIRSTDAKDRSSWMNQLKRFHRQIDQIWQSTDQETDKEGLLALEEIDVAELRFFAEAGVL